MRTYVQAVVESGEFATPNEINDELRDIIGSVHALDRDNFPALEISAGKFALGAWGNILITPIEVDVDVTHPAAPGGVDTTEVHPIPREVSAGNIIPWVEVMDTGDGELEVSLGAMWSDDTDLEESYVWIGIRVDGTLVVRSPTQQAYTFREHAYVVWTVPVQAGPHIIEPVYGRGLTSAAKTITWKDRLLAVREMAR